MNPPLRQALVGVGANLGDRCAALRRAVDRLRLEPEIGVVEASPVYETAPVGLVDQPAFLNAVVGLETSLPPEALLSVLQRLENEAGRIRTVRWGPRPLDLDLLAFEGETRATPSLELPHPRMLERRFVTVPLAALLARPRFQRPAWDALRQRLAAPTIDSSAVTVFSACILDAPDYGGAQEYLLALKQRGVQPGLDRMDRFVAALGHPERAIPCVHVAGTNGKGSVAAMLEAIFRAAGWRTGLYTSPHLVRLGERIQVNRQPLTPDQIATHVAALRPIADRLAAEPGGGPSYFEFMTAVAFAHFAATHCDIAIIETGMGGRLDATNVVVPEASILTSVGMDHAEFLGDTVAKIAAEKAGIIKPGRTVIMGPMLPEAEQVIRARAAEVTAPIISVATAFRADGADFPATNLRGQHQRANAATAALTAKVMAQKWRLTPDGIAHALQHVDWPGRWQEIPTGDRRLVLEAAHNADGAAALSDSLARLAREDGKAPVIVVGVLGATRARPLLEAIARHAAEIHLVVPRQSRACSHEELISLLPPGVTVPVRRSSIAELFPVGEGCRAGDPASTIVVTGSLYLVGEVLARLEPDRGSLEDHLQDF
jgi:dihydrofolate synthase/folylpolyglutamate synthase